MSLINAHGRIAPCAGTLYGNLHLLGMLKFLREILINRRVSAWVMQWHGPNDFRVCGS